MIGRQTDRWQIHTHITVTLKFGEDIQQLELILLMEEWNDITTYKNCSVVSYEIKQALSYDPPIPYSAEIRTNVYKNIYIRMLIASLFIIEKKLKQKKCRSLREWIKIMI